MKRGDDLTGCVRQVLRKRILLCALTVYCVNAWWLLAWLKHSLSISHGSEWYFASFFYPSCIFPLIRFTDFLSILKGQWVLFTSLFEMKADHFRCEEVIKVGKYLRYFLLTEKTLDHDLRYSEMDWAQWAWLSVRYDLRAIFPLCCIWQCKLQKVWWNVLAYILFFYMSGKHWSFYSECHIERFVDLWHLQIDDKIWRSVFRAFNLTLLLTLVNK